MLSFHNKTQFLSQTAQYQRYLSNLGSCRTFHSTFLNVHNQFYPICPLILKIYLSTNALSNFPFTSAPFILISKVPNLCALESSLHLTSAIRQKKKRKIEALFGMKAWASYLSLLNTDYRALRWNLPSCAGFYLAVSFERPTEEAKNQYFFIKIVGRRRRRLCRSHSCVDMRKD